VDTESDECAHERSVMTYTGRTCLQSRSHKQRIDPDVKTGEGGESAAAEETRI